MSNYVPRSGYDAPPDSVDLSKESPFYVQLSKAPDGCNTLWVWLGGKHVPLNCGVEDKKVGPGPGFEYVDAAESSEYDCLLVSSSTVLRVDGGGEDNKTRPDLPTEGQMFFEEIGQNLIQFVDGKWETVTALTPGITVSLTGNDATYVLSSISGSDQTWVTGA